MTVSDFWNNVATSLIISTSLLQIVNSLFQTWDKQCEHNLLTACWQSCYKMWDFCVCSASLPTSHQQVVFALAESNWTHYFHERLRWNYNQQVDIAGINCLFCIMLIDENFDECESKFQQFVEKNLLLYKHKCYIEFLVTEKNHI